MMIQKETGRLPIVEEIEGLDDRGQYATEIVVMGLTVTQIRGLKEFYTQLTGREDGDIPEIGAIRKDMAKLLGKEE